MDGKNFHIGKLIQERLKYEEHSISWLARKINCDRSNIYRIFEREHIDSELLLRLSVVLNYNFFDVYVKEYEELQKLYISNNKNLDKAITNKDNAK